MINEPIFRERRGRPRLILAGVILLLIGVAWFLRSSWLPQVFDTLIPALAPIARWGDGLRGDKTQSENAELTQLRAENELLARKLQALELVADENQQLRSLLKLPLPRGYRQVGAQIVLRPPHQWLESLTIDQGFEAGLNVNQVVMGPQGVLGKISEVTAKTATVQLISHPESTVACVVGKQKAPGVLIGQYRNEPAQLQYLQNYARIQAGDLVLTSGLGGVFPPNLLLGRVAEVRQVASRPVPEASITLVPLETHLDQVIVLIPEGGSEEVLTPPASPSPEAR